MPDMKQVFSSEIRRIAHREIKAVLKPVIAQNVELKKRLNAMEREIKEMQKQFPAPELPPVDKQNNDEVSVPAKIPRITKERILALRKKLNLSQGEFAKLLGVASGTICHWEIGKNSPRLELKIRIAEVRDMKPSAIKALMLEKGILCADVAEPNEPEPVAEETTEEETVESEGTFDKTAFFEFRKKNNLSQGKIAALLGVFYSSIRRWETGEGLPREPQKAKIEALLALTPEQLAERLDNLPLPKRPHAEVSG